MNNSLPLLVYVFDPLCGWCYGFSPVVRRLWETTRDKTSWEVISGGMVRGDRVRPIGEIRDFLQQAIPRLEATTGVEMSQVFKDNVLAEGSLVLGSVEPSRALTAAKAIDPEVAVPFAAALQQELYVHGRDVRNTQVLEDLAARFHLKEFPQVYARQAIAERTESEFKLAADWGITGFPTLLGITPDGKAQVFSRGWVPFERLQPAVNRWLGTLS